MRSQKVKNKILELVFYAVSKNVVVFDKAPWKSPALTNLFRKIRNKHFENKIIFLAPKHQGKECAPILIAPTLESYLGKMQKHEELASSAYSQQLMLRTLELSNLLFFGRF